MKFWIKQILMISMLMTIGIFISEIPILKKNNIFLFLFNGFVIFIIQLFFKIQYEKEKQKDLESFKNLINKDFENYRLEITKELEYYRSKLTGNILVTKLQYELEFNIYKDLYSGLMILFEKICKKENQDPSEEVKKYTLEVLRCHPFLNSDIADEIYRITNFFNSYLKGKEKDLDLGREKIQRLAVLIKNRIEQMKIIA